MGFNLGNAFAGAVGGFGAGMAMNAKSDIDAQQQAETDRRRADIETMRTTAMAKLQREMTQPDRDQAKADGVQRQANFDRTATSDEKYKQGMLDDKTERNRLGGIANDARAETNALRAQTAADRANGGGASGGSDKPGKLGQTLTDAETIHLKGFKEREQALKSIIEPAERETERLNIKREQFGTLGGAQIRINRDGTVEMQDRSGGHERFKNAADAQAKGFGSDELSAKVQAVNDFMAKQKSDAGAKTSGAAQNAAADKFAASPDAGRSLRGTIEGAEKPVSPQSEPSLSQFPANNEPQDRRTQDAAIVAASRVRLENEKQGKSAATENTRAMIRQNYQSYSPEQAQQMLDTYGSMLAPAELMLLQKRIRMAR